MLTGSRFALVIALSLTSSLLLDAQQNELRSLANSLAQDIAAAGKKTIAVVDFTDLQGNPTELGRFLAEEFAVAMTRTRKGFEVIDRNHIKTILKEHKLTSTGLIDPATAKKLGHIVGADALLTGSLTPFSESVRVAVKVLDTNTARIIAADNADLPKTKTITELISARSDSGQIIPGGDHSDSEVQPSSSRDPAPRRSPTATSEEFVFELLQCRGLGNSARCTFRITNRGPDRSLRLFCNDMPTLNDNYIQAFDDAGTQVNGVDCSIANQRQGKFIGGDVEAVLISGIPVTASILFQQLHPSNSSLALISIKGAFETRGGGRYGSIEMSFRNVPIVR
jgi:TolB-like protein